MSKRRRDLILEAQRELARRRRFVAHRTLRKRAETRIVGGVVKTPRVLPMPPIPAIKAPHHAPLIETPEAVIEEFLTDDAVADTVALDLRTKPAPKKKARPEPEPEPEPEPQTALVPKVEPATKPLPIPKPKPAPASAPNKRKLAVGIGVAVLVGAYVGAQAWAGSAAPQGAEVLGVDLSGKPAQQVRDELLALAKDVNETPIAITVDANTTEFLPSAAGLEMNGTATANRIVGFSLDPRRLITRLSGGAVVEPVVARNAQSVTSAVDDAAEVGLNQEAIEATVEMTGPSVQITAGQPRIAVDVQATATEIVERWPHTSTFAAVASVESPELTTEEAVRFQKAMNEWVFAKDVTLTSPNGNVLFTPEEFAKYTSFEVQDGHISLTVNGQRLARDLRSNFPYLENEARNAFMGFDDSHMLVVDPGQPKRVIDEQAMEKAAIAAASGLNHSGPIVYIETPPDITAESISVGDFTHRISTFTTPFTPRESRRERNIANAANRMSGYIIQPGEVFSLAAAIGPVDSAHGYVSAGAIIGNVHSDAMGGGLSQMATTAYNAGYFAGLEDVQHKPHSEWFARYPAGREATLFLPGLDMKFRNDTPYAILVNAYVENASVTVDLWSTPYYTVETVSSGKYNIRSGGTVYSSEPGCTRQGSSQGFTITNTRYVYLDGNLVKEEPFTWTYRAVPAIVCQPAE